MKKEDDAEKGRWWRIRRMSRIWKRQDLDTELIWSEEDMSEPKTEQESKKQCIIFIIMEKLPKFMQNFHDKCKIKGNVEDGWKSRCHANFLLN